MVLETWPLARKQMAQGKKKGVSDHVHGRKNGQSIRGVIFDELE